LNTKSITQKDEKGTKSYMGGIALMGHMGQIVYKG
jgi:hypothetical protein